MRETLAELGVIVVGLVLLSVGLSVTFGWAWACIVVGGLLLALGAWSAAAGPGDRGT
jgi:type IV secretory pathway VirB2 component (pilin)